MTKVQAAALLLAGTIAGVGGEKLVAAFGPSVAEAKVLAPYVHAADLRRDKPVALEDGGFAKAEIRVLAYASFQGSPDAGAFDMGQAKSCIMQPPTKTKANELMTLLASDCVWLDR